MDPRDFETPRAQKSTGPNEEVGLSSNSTISSSASFISQIPLPYYLPPSQDARYAQPPPRPTQNMASYGHGGYGAGGGRAASFAVNFAPIQEHPGQHPSAAQYAQQQGRGPNDTMGGQGHGYSQHQQQPGGPGMSGYSASSYNPYGGRSNDGYQQSSDDTFSSRYSSSDGFYSQGPDQRYIQGPPQNYNQGRPGSAQNQWQPVYRSQNQNENQNQQMYGGYQQQQSYGQNAREPLASWNNNRYNGGAGSVYDDEGGPRGRHFKDHDFMVNKGLIRRRSAGPAQQYGNPRLNNFSGGRGKRHNSFDQSRQPAQWTNYDTRTGRPEYTGYSSANASAVNTPKASCAQPPQAPTPRTARELGQATPSHLEQSARKERHEELVHGPPPPFSLNPALESPNNPPRGRSNSQDPFTAVSVQKYSLPRSLSTQNHLMSGRSRVVGSGPSPHLAALAPGGQKPTITVAFDAANMPFVETARLHPSTSIAGVIRINNIPFSVTSQEILAFFGRNARTVAEHEEPVHIVMERVTSKTMEAFVEFIDIHEAIFAIEKFEQRRMSGSQGKLGDRHVELEICGQEVLMQALFPKAKNVKWVGINPKISNHTDQWNSGFKGFVSREELVMLEKHVEAPARSPFSKNCPQRPFECLISTLTKYPWNRLDVITIADRDALHATALSLCKHLMGFMEEGVNELQFDERLLRRIKRAVFNCHGFSDSQKDDFAYIFDMPSIDAGLPPYAEQWFVFKTIGAKRGWTPDVILYYMALIREATTSSAVVSLAEQAAQGQQTKLASPFGNMKIEYLDDVANMSLSDVGAIEWHAIEAVFRKILPSEN